MTVHSASADALEYYPCRYGDSRVSFRGPRRDLEGDYVAFLGGTDTYGRFVEAPYCSLLEERLGVECVNFGLVNAGVDLYLQDPTVLDLASQARVKVVQIMDAQNMSNRFYQVHPRRNDRFLSASEMLEALYPEVDFTEFHFNRHMLATLRDISEERFEDVVTELRMAWIARMRHMLTILRGRVILTWFSDRPLQDVRAEPPFVNRETVDVLRPRVSAFIDLVQSDDARKMGTVGMVFSDYEACAAKELLGPRAHVELADALEPKLRELLDL